MTGSLKEMLFAQTSTSEGITWCGITPSYLPHVLGVGRPLLKSFDWSRRTRLCMVKFSFHRMTHSDASRWPNYNGLFRLKLISPASDRRHSPVPAQTLRLRFLEAGGISSGSSPRPTSMPPGPKSHLPCLPTQESTTRAGWLPPHSPLVYLYFFVVEDV